MTEFVNNSGLDFVDISSEAYREYVFSDSLIIKINQPLRLNVSKTGGHRVFDADGVSHYVNSGWKHLRWKAKPGQPNFVK
jgi:hypothetical protein